MEDVRQFNLVMNKPARTIPELPCEQEREHRRALLEEEYEEYLRAEETNDLVGIADGLADMIYIIAGTAWYYGIPLEKVWDDVQNSNMKKIWPDGTIKQREDGKIKKPPYWKGPNISSILEKFKDGPKKRGQDFPCENCGLYKGSALSNGWYRCAKCGYPSK